MAPFTASVVGVRQIPSSNRSAEGGFKTAVFEGNIDEDWLVGVVPNGGYVLALIVQACNLMQQGTPLLDPLYLSTQFIYSCTMGPCQVVVKNIKQGRNYSNLTAELVQNGKTNIHCQLIYSSLPIAKHSLGPFPASPSYFTHAHPSLLSRRCPMSTHPSKCKMSPLTRPFAFNKHVLQSLDPFYSMEMDKLARGEEGSLKPDLGGGVFIIAAWIEILNEEDIITAAMLPFLGDLAPDKLPPSLAQHQNNVWFPTLSLSIDFKYRPPSPDSWPEGIAKHTVGVYTSHRFLIDGRHELTAELWMAPSGIGKGVEEEGWQERMFCLAVVTQCALTVPAAINTAKANRKSSKL